MGNIHVLQENIYITSDEEIKEGDWYISFLENEVYKATKETQNIMSVANLVGSTSYKKTHFKIILTTDQDLIKDGEQAIDDEFLEWFVKNPSCEEVEVEKLEGRYVDYSGNVHSPINYKIIIPKEETKQEGYICPHTLLQCDDECCVSAEDCHIKEWTYLSEPKQETLEELAERYYQDEVSINAFINGAKWQQEKSYSEEEVLELLLTSKIEKHEDIKEWFEKFKKP
jgi:hypothetical protein